MADTEFTISTAMVVEFAGEGQVCCLPVDGEGAKTYCQETGATVTYRPGFVSVQVTREGGDVIHSWLLTLRWGRVGACVGWFNGDMPTDGDLDRLKEVAVSAHFDISGALARQDPLAYGDDERLEVANALIDAIVVRFAQPTVLARRGSAPGVHLLPGDKA
jgi:hypothetical protein